MKETHNESPCMGGLNYEAELEKAKREIDKLKEECRFWQIRFEDTERENQRLRTIKQTVEAIFGREIGGNGKT